MTDTASSQQTMTMATKPTFSISDTLNEAWQLFKKNWMTLLALGFVTFIISVIINVIARSAGRNGGAILLIQVAAFVVNTIISLGWIRVLLKIARGQTAGVEDFQSGMPYFWNYLLGNILYSLIVVVGFILFIIPGIIWSVQYHFIPYLIADKGVGPMQAMRMSSQMTKDLKFKIWLFFLTMGLVAIGGLIVFVVGLLIAIPVISIATALLYLKLVPRASAE